MQKHYAQELRKSLGESREWVEQLLEELETAQGLIFALRRDLSRAKGGAPNNKERKLHHK